MSMLFVFAFLALNLLTSASEDTVTWPKWAYIICTGLFMFYTFIVLMSKQTAYSRPIVRHYVRVLLISLLILTYTAFLALFHSYSFYDWLTDFWSFAPLLLAFNFACFVSTRAQWLRIFSLIILLGDAASLRDFAMQSGLSRMASGQMANVDFFVAAFLCIGFLIFYENGRLFMLSAFSLPLLLLRTVLSGNRSMVVLLGLAVLGMLLKKAFGPGRSGDRRKVIHFWASAVVLMLVFAGFTVMGGAALQHAYAFLGTRFESTQSGLNFRGIEAAVVWSQFTQHPLGTGFGSSAYFPGLKHFTANSQNYKSYVHNLPLYCLWKLGVLGILLLVVLARSLVKMLMWTWRCRDPLPFIAYTVVFQYVGYSMVETYFRRHDYNLIVGIVLGFLIYAQRSASLETAGPTKAVGIAGRGEQRRSVLVS